MPELLKVNLIRSIANQYHKLQVQCNAVQVARQSYNNCGAVVIENFMANVTGNRINGQEEVVKWHSILLEEWLLLGEDALGLNY